MLEKLTGLFSLGLLLRSAFAGAFFVLSLCVALWGQPRLTSITASELLEFGPLVALVAGITAYTVHRSLLFPLMEWGLNSGRARGWRENRWLVLISTNTMDQLKRSWCRGFSSDSHAARVSYNLTVWGDYLHFQYAATLCIAAGSMCGHRLSQAALSWNGPLIALAAVLFLAAFVSNWRWHAIEERLPVDNASKATAKTTD